MARNAHGCSRRSCWVGKIPPKMPPERWRGRVPAWRILMVRSRVFDIKVSLTAAPQCCAVARFDRQRSTPGSATVYAGAITGDDRSGPFTRTHGRTLVLKTREFYIKMPAAPTAHRARPTVCRRRVAAFSCARTPACRELWSAFALCPHFPHAILTGRGFTLSPFFCSLRLGRRLLRCGESC